MFDTMLPEVVQVADPFHVVRLANTALDECRRRVQNETLGHRGRQADPLYRARRRLVMARERLSDDGHERLLAQILAGRGLAAATVAVEPAPFRGVLPLPISALKSASPVLGNPANHGRAVPLTYEQFRFAFANAVTEDEAKELYNTFAMPASGVPLFQAATGNLNPWTEAKVNTKNPDRGPLLIVDREKDNTVPWAIANASCKKQKRNQGVTEIVKIADRGHALTIDHGWREVADTVLGFVRRFVQP